MDKTQTIAKSDWLKVDWSKTFGPDVATKHAAMLEANKARKEAVAKLVETRLADEANEAFEQAVAAALVASGQLTEGKRAIISRFGDLADPAKHSKDATKKATASGKRVFELAAVYSADKKRKA